MTRPKLVVTDMIFSSLKPERALMDEVGGSLVVCESQDEEALCAACRDATAILTCFAQVTREVVTSAEKCDIIVRYGTGTDTIDVAEATKRGIIVANVPEYCSGEVAEHTLALLLGCARQVYAADRSLRQGAPWSIDLVRPLHSLSESTVGIVGFGKISRAVIRRLSAFGVEILVYARPHHAGAIADLGCRAVSLSEMLHKSDFVSLHIPLTEDTEGLIGEAELRSMKSSAFLINTARGGIVDSEALAQALEEKWIAGAAVDVLLVEPPETSERLLSLENTIVTPHTAFYTEETLTRLQRRTVAEVRRFFHGQPLCSVVNREVQKSTKLTFQRTVDNTEHPC